MKKKPLRLTRLQRYTAYCIMLARREDFECEICDGLCFVIAETFGLDNEGFYEGDNWGPFSHVLSYFPELENRFYEANGFYDWDERAAALIQCINETHPDK